MKHFPEKAVSITAKTGFLTKEFWEEFIFQGGSKRWKNVSWKALQDRGYFMPYPNSRVKNVLVLNRYNKNVISAVQSVAAKAPSISQFTHDEVLLRGIMTAERAGSLTKWMTEAELKMHGKTTFLIQSQGDYIKYPDAVVACKDTSKEYLAAIELEMTLKSRKRYVQILSAYAAMKHIRSIIFICKDLAIERAIKEMMDHVYFPTKQISVTFVTLNQWRQQSVNVLKDAIPT
ncbi:MAG: hypothetical protein AB7F59_09585 [Bdellovibrionales bacterium]